MSFNDPIAELLTKIRNASKAKHAYVDMMLSRSRKTLLEIMKQKGFIQGFLVDEKRRRMRIFLKYIARRPVLKGLKRVSKPGHKKFVPFKKIPKVLSGNGIAIVSTSKGVMEGEEARSHRVGGEVWCFIW